MSARQRQRMRQQAQRINRNYKALMDRVRGEMTEATMTEILSAIDTRATFYEPLDTAALRNSKFRRVRMGVMGWTGQVGYTVNYAAALHERQDWQPRQPADRPARTDADGNRYGAGTGGYNPQAQPGFLQQGAGEAIARDLPRILRIEYEL